MGAGLRGGLVNSVLGLVFLGGCLSAPSSLGADLASAGPIVGDDGKFAIGWDLEGKWMNPYQGFAYRDVGNAAAGGPMLARGQLGGVYAQPVQCEGAEVCSFSSNDHVVYRMEWFNVTLGPLSEQPPTEMGAHRKEGSPAGVEGMIGLPAVGMNQAAWGVGRIDHNGQTLENPVTGSADWKVHYMLLRDGVRDDLTGVVHRAARKAVYDPAVPQDFHVQPGDAEIHLILDSGVGATYPARTDVQSNSVTLTSFIVYHHNFYNWAPGGIGRMWVNVTSAVPVELEVSLRSPTGAVIRNVTISRPSRMDVPLEFPASDLGTYFVRVTGTTARADYSIAMQFEARPVLFNLWFEQVYEGQAAISQAEKWGFRAR